MKQLKPRDKITQKMTRDGAVEINETQQTAERISSREADSDRYMGCWGVMGRVKPAIVRALEASQAMGRASADRRRGATPMRLR